MITSSIQASLYRYHQQIISPKLAITIKQENKDQIVHKNPDGDEFIQTLKSKEAQRT